ncbi:MAG: phage tail tape measure protein, partial [Bacteroidota bacterium]
MATERLIARVGADVSGFKSGMNSAVGIAKSTALRITAAFAGVMLTSALIGSKFEKTLTETATVAQAFGKDLEALEHKARELGRTTAFTATEAAKGMYDLASAGMNTKQIIDATEHSMKLAGATNSEMSQATSLVSSALKQFGLDASHAKRVVDTYAQAITKSKLTMDRLTEAMKYAGTTGAALGWEIEETTAAVAQFADLGLEGSMAGTNLRMAMMELTKQSGDMSDALSDMGLSFLDVNPEARTFGEILYTLGEKGMTAAQAIAIFGARAGLNMKQLSQAAFIGNSDFAGFVEQLKKAQEGIGRTAEMYNRMMDEFHGDWKIMMSALQDLSIEFFQQFEADGRIIFQRITQYLNEFSGWIRGHGPEIRTFFSGIREQILGIADRFKEWLNTNKELISQGIPNMIKKIGDGLGSIVTLYKSLPDEIIGPTGTGLVVRMLTGSTKIALYAAILHGLYNTIVKINEEGEKASQRIASEGTEVKIKRLEEVKAELEKAYRSKKFGRPEELNKSKYRWTPIDAISAQIDAVEKKINVFKDALSDPGEIFISTDKI